MRWQSAGLCALLVASLAGTSAATPATAVTLGPLAPLRERVVPVEPVPVLPPPPDPASTAATSDASPVSWPAAAAVEVDLRATSTGAATTRTAGIPVRVRPATPAAPPSRIPPSGTAAGSPATVRVEVVDRAGARTAGVAGLLVKLRRTDSVASAGPVSVTVDYGGFRHAYGGDWADRLRMVRLADNAVLPSRNDRAAGTVTAQVDVSGQDSVFALAAGPSGAGGSYAATPLALTSSWQVSGQTGEFSWSYPLRTPEAPGGLSPQLAVSYSSAAVDGRTASTNNQPSWVGEGFDLWSGYIERSYKGCADDQGGNNGQRSTGDQCWFTDNATMSLAGLSGELVRDDATGVWRLDNDEGARIEKLTGAGNGDNDGEYWKVTNREGVQYFFGRNRLPGWASGQPETRSAWTVPVFGNHVGEPCHNAAGYATSWCHQAYRWNLDHVVDPRGNAVVYYYTTEGNSYGLDMGRQTVGYDRGGVLLRAEFGLRRGAELTGTAAPASVVFGTAERCLSGCTVRNASTYPDVPFDQECTANCATLVSPTFWTTKRLTGITAQIGATPVERWTLEHGFPLPGDGSRPALWLKGINHTGVYATTAAQPAVTLPAVTFAGEAKPNRVNSAADGLPPMNKYRVIAITNEFGGVIGIDYAPTNCVAGALPAPENNTLRCFPVHWQPDGSPALTDWMHKYVVSSVVQVDRVGGSPTEVTTYDYQGGGAWRYNDNELVKAERRTWSQWRGYPKVAVLRGETGAPRAKIEYLYFRGMNGDRLAPAGGVKSISIVDSQGGRLADDDHLNGVVREKVTFNGVGGPVTGGTITDPWQRGPTAAHGTQRALMVETGTLHERVALAGGGWRRTQIGRSYNADGLVTQIDDRGDLAVSGDEECTRTSYARNATTWQLGLPSRVESVARVCGATPSFPADAISDVRTTYDTAGNPTTVEQVADYSDGQPVYATISRTTYDTYGRPLDTHDALDRRTSTAYTQTAGLTTKLVVTNVLGHTTTAELSPAWGEPITSWDANKRRTDIRYDPLGRVTGVWLPGRNEPAGEGPNLRYRYLVRPDGPTAVSTDTLRANNNYATTHALYDGFLRPRQTQAPAWTAPGVPGGRVITDTVYDSRGLLVKKNGNYFAEGAPGTTLVAAGDNNIPSQTITVHDGADRATASIMRSLGVEKWRSSTAYHGDHTDHTPPPGGTATTVHLNADGRTTALHQYHGPAPFGPADVTRYTYTGTGQLASVTDPAGNQWRYGYDVRGRRVRVHDADRGDSTSRYDAAGQLLSATDARGTTLAYTYDRLGRRTEERDGAGNLLARWAFDVPLLGLPTSNTRIDNGHAYTSEVVGYDAANRPTGTRVTIPAAEGALAGSYQTGLTYRPDGSLASLAMPRAGTVDAETLTLEYDDFGLPRKTSGAAMYVEDTWYTRFGEASALSMGGRGAKVWLDTIYDEATRRLARSTVRREAAANSFVDDFRYEYDPAGNVSRIADVPEGGPADIQCFRYDHLRRMAEAWTAAGACAPGVVGGAAPYRTSYVFDLTGNRTGETRHGLGGVADTTRTYRYTGAHALASVTTAGPGGSTVDSFDYDATGNTVSRNLAGSTQTLTWDTAGRLRAARAADGTDTTFVYDADGNRLLRRDPVASTLYLGGQEIRWDRGANVTSGNRFYAHGSTGVAVRTAAGVYWQAGDHHGTTTTSVKADSLAVTRRQFTPFGDPRGPIPASWPDEHGFVGGTRDDSLGLTRLGAREYDTSNGRFISLDPVIDPTEPQQLNGYAYANNSPATYADPDGLFPDCGCASDRYGYDNVLHNANGSLLSESDATKWLSPKQKSKWKKKVLGKAQRDQERRNYERKVRASGHTVEEYEQAKKIQEKSVLDVVIEAGGEVIKEFLGINDIKNCFGNGDIGACISMIINIIPWSKVFRIGELIGAVRKAWNAVMSFRDKQRWADNVIGAVCTKHSFRPDTKVRMADGSSKPIGQVKLGDTVLATDPKAGKTSARRVVASHINNDRDLVDLGVRAGTGVETVHTTEHHPFWSEIKQVWVDAGRLEPGDTLRTEDGRRAEVATVHRYVATQIMRDLTVDGVHTYYVVAGGSPILVHNCDGSGDALADYADMNRGKTNVASEVTNANGARGYGISRGRDAGDLPAEVRNAVEASGHHGGCAEVGGLCDLAGRGEPLAGLTARSVTVAGGSKGYPHMQPMAMCSSCARLFRFLNG